MWRMLTLMLSSFLTWLILLPAVHAQGRLANARANAGSAALEYQLQISDPKEIGTRGSSYLDPEILQGYGLMTWSDGVDDTVWVCELDPDNGDLIPRDGRGTRIGKSAPFIPEWFKQHFLGYGERGTLNGPEWGNSLQGPEVFFTIKDDNGIYQQAKCLLSDLKVHQITFGGDEDRFGNLPTQNATDEVARVGYFQMKDRTNELTARPTYWKFSEAAQPQHPIPLDVWTYIGPRWIPGRPAITTYLTAPDDTIQVAEFNVDTQETTFLTEGPEDHFDGLIVKDPVTSTQKYLLCNETLSSIALYEWNGAAWSKVRTYTPLDIDPALLGRVTGPRPFIVDDRLFFLYYAYADDSTKIYIASGDGAVNQRLINGNLPHYQTDPELFVGSQPNVVFVYFYTSLPANFLHRFGKLYRLKIVVESTDQ